ncbi:MAG TPA: L-threonylcarbamoyladenylate synthase [Armatimonadota bacterium]|jgi:L-threonylcarbamoyladenylate synthase
METRLLRTDPAHPDPAILQEAGRILRAGGLVVMPTETVYGLAADALNPEAVAALRAAKARPEEKPLPVMVSGAADIPMFTTESPSNALSLAAAFWPGPLTLVLEANQRVGESVHAGTGKVGLRAPDHAVAQGILLAAGRPLALTSANIAGQAPARSAQEALAALNGRVDLIVDAGPAALGEPSTVLDLTCDPPRILRPGGVSIERLRRLLSDLA